MRNFSKNKKLNGILNDIYQSLEDLGLEEVKRYHDEFKFKGIKDYNIVEYGNLLIYYGDIRDLSKKNGYKTIDKMRDDRLWATYKSQVGYRVRFMLCN